MPIVVTNIKIGLEEPEENAVDKAIRMLGVPESKVTCANLYKKSLDARKKKNIVFVASVLLELSIDEEAFCLKKGQRDIQYKPEKKLRFQHGTQKLDKPVYVVGFGPAGMLCAYSLAKNGYRPVVLERGYDVNRRSEAVERFWKSGVLDSECNVQFGEGGAGTFSDGKLTTRISDERCDYVLRLLHQFGAPDDILTKAKPHIGTDYLRQVVTNMRREIISLGGEVRFGHRLEKLHHQNGKLLGITVNGDYHETGNIVLALGHSARDTFTMLYESDVAMQAKDFSVGVRMEHLQSEINRSLYGSAAGHPALPQGEYQLSYREKGRGVYTFCMCPGGVVVPSSSCAGTVVTNGMSEYSRNSRNANSAMVVSVSKKDYGSGVLDGMHFQQELERKAFVAGGGNYRAPAATVDDFLSGKTALTLGRVRPSYALGCTPCDFRKLFPPAVTSMLETGLMKFEQKIKNFAAADSVMTGVETRTSSPVRLPREEGLQSRNIAGLYPCGEGAGYAGGIMSAAVDGIRVAQAIMKCFAPIEQ